MIQYSARSQIGRAVNGLMGLASPNPRRSNSVSRKTLATGALRP
jgi:hypothetical protein